MSRRRLATETCQTKQLFRARATPVYNIVAFEASHDIQRDDPLKKAFEYARMARRYASKIQVRKRLEPVTSIVQKCIKESYSKCPEAIKIKITTS